LHQIRLRTLTPLWTGDIEQNSAHIKDTSIIGSLRWWYEALVRGIDGDVCNITSQNPEERCDYEKNKHEICNVCELFGCTGYSRRFRLEAEGFVDIPLFFVTHENVYLSNGNWISRIFGGTRNKNKEGRGTTFSLSKRMLFSPHPVEIRISTLDLYRDVYSAIYFLFWFISEYGGLGAKTQNGFGQVEFMEPNNQLLKKGKQFIKDNVRNGKERKKGFVFDLKDFFSIEFEIEDKNPYYGVGREIGNPPEFDYRKYFIPCGFDVRYKMRSKNPFTNRGENWGMRPFFLEKLGANNEAKKKTQSLLGDAERGSRIFVSHLFKATPEENYHIRVWGFVPKEIEQKERVVGLIKNYICDKRTFYGAKIIKEYEEGVFC
jgi:CRISPR-associated protein Cmr1